MWHGTVAAQQTTSEEAIDLAAATGARKHTEGSTKLELSLKSAPDCCGGGPVTDPIAAHASAKLARASPSRA